MNIPKHIRESIEKSSKAFAKARENERIVRDWLEENYVQDETTNDQWIDCVEMGNGQHQSFIDYLKDI